MSSISSMVQMLTGTIEARLKNLSFEQKGRIPLNKIKAVSGGDESDRMVQIDTGERVYHIKARTLDEKMELLEAVNSKLGQAREKVSRGSVTSLSSSSSITVDDSAVKVTSDLPGGRSDLASGDRGRVVSMSIKRESSVPALLSQSSSRNTFDNTPILTPQEKPVVVKPSLPAVRDPSPPRQQAQAAVQEEEEPVVEAVVSMPPTRRVEQPKQTDLSRLSSKPDLEFMGSSPSSMSSSSSTRSISELTLVSIPSSLRFVVWIGWLDKSGGAALNRHFEKRLVAIRGNHVEYWAPPSGMASSVENDDDDDLDHDPCTDADNVPGTIDNLTTHKMRHWANEDGLLLSKNLKALRFEMKGMIPLSNISDIQMSKSKENAFAFVTDKKSYVFEAKRPQIARDCIAAVMYENHGTCVKLNELNVELMKQTAASEAASFLQRRLAHHKLNTSAAESKPMAIDAPKAKRPSFLLKKQEKIISLSEIIQAVDDDANGDDVDQALIPRDAVGGDNNEAVLDLPPKEPPSTRYRVVCDDGAYVRQSPHIKSEFVRRLDKGDVVKVFDRITLPNGIGRLKVDDGWISERLMPNADIGERVGKRVARPLLVVLSKAKVDISWVRMVANFVSEEEKKKEASGFWSSIFGSSIKTKRTAVFHIRVVLPQGHAYFVRRTFKDFVKLRDALRAEWLAAKVDTGRPSIGKDVDKIVHVFPGTNGWDDSEVIVPEKLISDEVEDTNDPKQLLLIAVREAESATALGSLQIYLELFLVDAVSFIDILLFDPLESFLEPDSDEFGPDGHDSDMDRQNEELTASNMASWQSRAQRMNDSGQKSEAVAIVDDYASEAKRWNGSVEEVLFAANFEFDDDYTGNFDLNGVVEAKQSLNLANALGRRSSETLATNTQSAAVAAEDDDDGSVGGNSTTAKVIETVPDDLDEFENTVTIQINKISALPMGTFGGLRDPYIQLKLKEKVEKSQIRKATVDPSWNPPFTVKFGVGGSSEMVVLSVFDRDSLFGDVPLGDVCLRVTPDMVGKGWKKIPSSMIDPSSGQTLTSSSVIGRMKLTSRTIDKLTSIDMVFEYEARPLIGTGSWSKEYLPEGFKKFVHADNPKIRSDTFEDIQHPILPSYVVDSTWCYESTGTGNLQAWNFSSSVTADEWDDMESVDHTVRRRTWTRVSHHPSITPDF